MKYEDTRQNCADWDLPLQRQQFRIGHHFSGWTLYPLLTSVSFAREKRVCHCVCVEFIPVFDNQIMRSDPRQTF